MQKKNVGQKGQVKALHQATNSLVQNSWSAGLWHYIFFKVYTVLCPQVKTEWSLYIMHIQEDPPSYF